MAQANVTINNIWYSYENLGTWDNVPPMMVAGNCIFNTASYGQITRNSYSKMKITIPVNGKATSIFLKMSLSRDSLPQGCKAYLSTADIAWNDITNGQYGVYPNGPSPSDSLINSSIAVSEIYLDSDCTKLHQGYWTSGYVTTDLFIKFNLSNISILANTSYYIYLIPEGKPINGEDKPMIYGSHSLDGYSVTLNYIPIYTISYNANGGSSTPSAQEKQHDSSIVLADAISKDATTYNVVTTFDANGGNVIPTSLNSTAYIYYTFSGWKASDGTIYKAKATYSGNASTTMTAQWSSSTSGSSINLPVPTRDGYTFDGWYSASTGGSIITSYSPTSNTTLYAHWTIINYTVSYNSNGGSGSMSSEKISYGGSHTVKENSFGAPASTSVTYNIILNANYSGGESNTNQVTNVTPKRFSIWRQNSTSGTTRAPGDVINSITSDITLYAIWVNGVTQKGSIILGSISRPAKTITGFTVSFDSQGGNSINSISSTKTVNYSHKGWSDSKNEYDTVSAYTFDSDAELSAIWSETYINNPIKLPAGPSRTGYEFLGWATSLNSNSYLQPGQEIVLTENVTYYAIWKALGSVFIYVNNSDKYLAALVFIYDGTNWKQAIPYLHDGTSWKLVAG